MEWMLLPYRRYFEFFGRSRRKEFWFFVLLNVLVSVVVTAIFGTVTHSMAGSSFSYGVTNVRWPGNWILNLFSLFSLIPSIALWVRRLHDSDRSGLWLLLAFIPLFGWFALLIFALFDGTAGLNRYGSDPKGRGDYNVF
jgi:uncharacterized membrane protein YhaH (DUF805 family)